MAYSPLVQDVLQGIGVREEDPRSLSWHEDTSWLDLPSVTFDLCHGFPIYEAGRGARAKPEKSGCAQCPYSLEKQPASHQRPSPGMLSLCLTVPHL